MIENFWNTLLRDPLSAAIIVILATTASRFKDTHLKIILSIFLYPAIHLLYLKNNGYGIRIEETGLNYYNNYLTEAFWTYIVSYLAFLAPLARKRNAKFSLLYTPKLNTISFWLVLACYFISAILANPWVFNLSARREQIPLGNVFISIYISLFVILVITSRRNSNKLKTIAIAIPPIILILSGERVSNILMLVVILTTKPKNKTGVSNFKSQAAIAISFALAIGAALISGEIRDATYSSDPSELSIEKIFNYTTVIESLHVYLSGFWYINNEGTTFAPLENIVFSLIPLHPLGGAGSPLFFEKIILSKITTVGGGVFLTEGLMIAGPVGAVIWSFALGFLLSSTMQSKSAFLNLLFLLIFILAFRIFWYGWTYIIPPTYILAGLFALLKFCSKKHLKNSHENNPFS